MRRRPLAALAAAVVLAGAAPILRSTGDERVLPPLHREFRSASGRFVLRIAAIDGWRTQSARAALSEAGAERWSRILPHQLGPRTAVVTDRGAVLLVDEWINTIPVHGLMLIDPKGRTLADHGGDAVFRTIGGPPAAIAAQAKVGTWRSGEPATEAGRIAIPTAGRSLSISLADGRLSVGR